MDDGHELLQDGAALDAHCSIFDRSVFGSVSNSVLIAEILLDRDLRRQLPARRVSSRIEIVRPGGVKLIEPKHASSHAGLKKKRRLASFFD